MRHFNVCSVNSAEENHYETRRRSVLKKTDRTEEAMYNISNEMITVEKVVEKEKKNSQT